MINAAKRPVLYLGGGVISSHLRVRTGGKSTTADDNDCNGAEVLPKAHPLSLGMLRMHGARSTNFILQRPIY